MIAQIQTPTFGNKRIIAYTTSEKHRNLRREQVKRRRQRLSRKAIDERYHTRRRSERIMSTPDARIQTDVWSKYDDVDPYHKLGIAVIAQAVRDIRHHDCDMTETELRHLAELYDVPFGYIKKFI